MQSLASPTSQTRKTPKPEPKPQKLPISPNAPKINPETPQLSQTFPKPQKAPKTPKQRHATPGSQPRAPHPHQRNPRRQRRPGGLRYFGAVFWESSGLGLRGVVHNAEASVLRIGIWQNWGLASLGLRHSSLKRCAAHLHLNNARHESTTSSSACLFYLNAVPHCRSGPL